MDRIPSEILEKFLDTVWHDELVAWERIDFMKSCPLVNREWRAIYNNIASRDVYIPSMQYLFYLLRVIGTGRSHVHCPNTFATKTRRIIVQKVELYGDHQWRRTEEQLVDHLAAGLTYSTLLRQLDHSSFVGVHICFPAATHFVFETISTFSHEEPYTRLSVRLDDRATAAIEWRVRTDSSILPSDEWSDEYRLEQARISADALKDCLCTRNEDRLPSEDIIRAALRYNEHDGTLAFDFDWEPEPFCELIGEDLDVYFRRAAVGYYSICGSDFIHCLKLTDNIQLWLQSGSKSCRRRVCHWRHCHCGYAGPSSPSTIFTHFSGDDGSVKYHLLCAWTTSLHYIGRGSRFSARPLSFASFQDTHFLFVFRSLLTCR